MILGLKTDIATAQLLLVQAENGQQLGEIHPELGRSMAKDLLGCLEQLLTEQDVGWHDITGIVVYGGPGSFTGLRIGAAVANTLAYSLDVPIVGITDENDKWLKKGFERLHAGENDKIVLPTYGREAHITQPRK